MAGAATEEGHRRRREEASAERIWADLPEGILHTVFTRLCTLIDCIAFSSVCRSWRAVASSLFPSEITTRFPPLLLRSRYSRLHRPSGLSLLDPASPFFSCSPCRNLNNVASVGFDFISSHGRLLRWSRNRVVIFNPFTGQELYSPVLANQSLSFSFSMNNSTLSFIGSGLLLFTSSGVFHWQIGSPTWSCYSPRMRPTDKLTIATVNGKVYAIDYLEILFQLDLSPELNLRPLVVDSFGEGSFCFQHFLVDCGGELLLLRLVPTEVIIYAKFEVRQLNLSNNWPRWVKKETLENWAIFVGTDPQVMGLAVENPERWGGRSNCVYFATGNDDGDCPWAVIKLGDVIDTSDPESPLFNGGSRLKLASAWAHPGF